MDPLTAGITYTAASSGAGAGAGAGAAFANPITAAIALAALATAYGASPSVRKGTNKAVKSGWEHVTNPWQHFGDGSEKDTMPLSQLLQGKNPVGGGGGIFDPNGMMGGSTPLGGGITYGEFDNLKLPGMGGMPGQSPQQNNNRKKQQDDNQQQAVLDRFLQSLSSQPLDVGYFNAPRASQFVAPEPKYLTTQPLQTPDPFSRRRVY